jgi:hypothetical protein
MNDIWVCAACKSINRQRDRRCYRCHEPAEAALATTGPGLRVESAVANRAVRGYRSTLPIAVVAGALIVAVAVLGVYLVVLQADGQGALKAAFSPGISSAAAQELLRTEAERIAVPSLLRGGLTILAVVAFAIWLSLVTANVPALGGGQPARSPVKALVYPLIPIVNLIKVPGMILDVLYRVDPQSGGAFMVIAAWIGLVGSWFVSLIGGWMITFAAVGRIVSAGSQGAVAGILSDTLDQGLILGIVTEAMIAGGAILLVMLMARIERRCGARDREIRSAAPA